MTCILTCLVTSLTETLRTAGEHQKSQNRRTASYLLLATTRSSRTIRAKKHFARKSAIGVLHRATHEPTGLYTHSHALCTLFTLSLSTTCRSCAWWRYASRTTRSARRRSGATSCTTSRTSRARSSSPRSTASRW